MAPIGSQRIHLAVNCDVKQDVTLAELIWKIEEIVSHLSGFYHLRPGDLIMTGTPSGVGPVNRGDKLSGYIEGVGKLDVNIV